MPKNYNIYPFTMDCSIDEKGNILVYELQPLAQSSLYHVNYKGRGTYDAYFQATDPVTADINKAFKKAFPDAHIVMNGRHQVKVDNSNASYRITVEPASYGYVEDPEELMDDNFYYYRSDRAVEDDLNDKLFQRLFLPKEVSPQYFIFDLRKKKEQDAEQISDLITFFKNSGIDRIVLKAQRSSDGEGNKFLDINDANFIAEMASFINARRYDGEDLAFLAEEQKIHLRINKKTGENKEGLRTFRVVGIAKEAGMLGFFVLSQNVSSSANSHERDALRVYLDGLNDDPKYRGSKDKYYTLTEGAFLLRQDLMEKIGIAAFKFFNIAQKCDNVSRRKLFLAGLKEQKAALEESPQKTMPQLSLNAKNGLSQTNAPLDEHARLVRLEPFSDRLNMQETSSACLKKTFKPFKAIQKPFKFFKHKWHNESNTENSNNSGNSMNHLPRA